MNQAKPVDCLVPESAWEIEGQKGLSFRLDSNEDGYYSYSSVKELPQVVKYDGQLYRRTGWNSDTGEVCYKEISPAKVARPIAEMDALCEKINFA